MIIVHAIFILLYFFIVWCKPRWALFLICALLPTYQLRFQFLGLPTTYLELMVVFLFFFYFIKNYQRIFKHFASEQVFKFRQIFKNFDWHWLIIAWLAVGLMAVIVSPDKWGGLGHWRAYFLEPILLLLVIVDLAKHDVDSRTISKFKNNTFASSTTIATILFGLSVSALFVSGWAIYQKIVGQGMVSLEVWQFPLQSMIRSTGLFLHSNFLGLFLGPLIILFLGQALYFLKEKKNIIRCLLFSNFCYFFFCYFFR